MDFFQQFKLVPEGASSMSKQVDALALFLTVLSLLITLLVFVLVVYFSLRYRRRTENEVPPETISRPWYEISWSIAIFIVFMVIFSWGAKLYVQERRPIDNALEINVIGKQWMWQIQHPGGQREIDELHVPVNQPVKLIMTSQDVIHSFGIPAFRITQDVLPGSYSTQWFTATKTGQYLLVCREYCGTMHSGMIGRVIVMEPQAYQAWLAGTAPDEPPITAGAKLFMTYGCAQCHGQIAPTLAGLFGRQVQLDDGSWVTADENYLRESILNAPARVAAGYPRAMPSYRGQLSEEQVVQLVDYIKSLAAAKSDGVLPTDRSDSAEPATRPSNVYGPDQAPNFPPARQPPGVGEPAPGGRQP